MSYQSTIRTKVQYICEAMGLSFLCETWSRANVVLDKFQRNTNGEVEGEQTLPCALFLQPASGTLSVSGRYDTFTDAPRCALSFLQAMPLDFTGEDVESITAELQAYAAQFISNANESGYFERIEGEVGYEVSFDKTDANLLVFTIFPTLREAVGQCVAPGEPRIEFIVDKDYIFLVAERE